EASWALLATHALIDAEGAARFALNGQLFSGAILALKADEIAGQPQTITNEGSNAATLTLTTFGVPSLPEPAGGKGYRIDRSWYLPDGSRIDPTVTPVPLGTRLVAVIEVTPLGPGEGRLMVSDPLPAGFEIDNPHLLRSGDVGAFDWLSVLEDPRTVEFRQDRFLAAVDRTGSTEGPFRLAYVVRAISPGQYHLPAATVEDMYRPDFRAQTGAGQITITE
ncbi:MAG: alpha-2-macroglobulin family protein, partial [Paracoccaceae bacterium]